MTGYYQASHYSLPLKYSKYFENNHRKVNEQMFITVLMGFWNFLTGGRTINKRPHSSLSNLHPLCMKIIWAADRNIILGRDTASFHCTTWRQSIVEYHLTNRLQLSSGRRTAVDKFSINLRLQTSSQIVLESAIL